MMEILSDCRGPDFPCAHLPIDYVAEGDARLGTSTGPLICLSSSSSIVSTVSCSAHSCSIMAGVSRSPAWSSGSNTATLSRWLGLGFGLGLGLGLGLGFGVGFGLGLGFGFGLGLGLGIGLGLGLGFGFGLGLG